VSRQIIRPEISGKGDYIPLIDLHPGKLPDLFRDFDEAMKHKQLPEIKRRTA